MNENEIKVYMDLADKAEEGRISFEELTKLNELHVVFLRKSYELALNNAEEQREIQDSLELIKEALEENETLNVILIDFIEEQGLTDEFKEFLDAAIDEAAKEVIEPNVIN